MDTVAVDLTGVRATALIELYARWRTARSATPSSATDGRGGRGTARVRLPSSTPWPPTASPSGRVAGPGRLGQGLLAAHPGAVVLDLGCGLDSRVFRVDPTAGHRRYDLDSPDVIEVKREPYRASGTVRLRRKDFE